jgi:hypothetical protein
MAEDEADEEKHGTHDGDEYAAMHEHVEKRVRREGLKVERHGLVI